MRKSRANLIKIICLTVISSSILAGCSSNSDLLKMLENNESIEIIVAEPAYASTVEHGTEQIQEWQPLGYRTNNLDFRLQVDEILNITPYNTNGKNGVLYIKSDGTHSDDTTLYDAFMNKAFVDKWNNSEVRSNLNRLGKELYAEINNEDKEAAFVNGYWNLFTDSVDQMLYFDGYTTVTRAEFLSAVYKSYNPVSTNLNIDEDLVYYVDVYDNNLQFVSQMLDQSYLNTEDFSLNDITYNSPICKAECIYTLVKTFYNEEFEQTTGSEKLDGFENGGNIAVEQGFISKDKERPNCWKAAELVYAIENNILPNDLYRAMVVADRHGLLDDMVEEGASFEWNEGVTKADALRLIIDTFETLGKENGYLVNNENGNSSIADELVNTQDAVMQDIYNGVSCLNHVKLENGKYVYTNEWREAMINTFRYFENAPEDVIDNFLIKFAEENKDCDGKTVYKKMSQLSERGYLYTISEENDVVDKQETTSNSNKEEASNKENNSNSNQNNTNSNNNQDKDSGNNNSDYSDDPYYNDEQVDDESNAEEDPDYDNYGGDIHLGGNPEDYEDWYLDDFGPGGN